METAPSLVPQSRWRRLFGSTFFSLSHRNFRLYFTGQALSNTGNWLTNIALTLLVLHLTNSGLDVGILAVCQYGPILLLSIWGGAIADRRDKRHMLLLTQCLEMLESIGLAILAFRPHPSLAGLFAVAVIGGTILAFDNPLRRSFVSEMVPEQDLPNAVVLYSSLVNLSRIFGPLLAGLLIVTLGYGWCFSVDAFSYLAVITSILLMRPEELFRHQTTQQTGRGQTLAGIRYVFSEPVLWISMTMLTIIGILSYNFSVTLPLFVAKGLHRTDTTYTILYSTMSIGSVITALFIARRQRVRLNHAIIGAAALGLSMLALAGTPGIPLASLIALFVGAASILYTTSTTVLIQTGATPHMRGRVLALQSILLMGTTPIGGPLLGWLADQLGGRAPLLLGGLASIAAAIIGLLLAKIYNPLSASD